jgi:hypothetical protein
MYRTLVINAYGTLFPSEVYPVLRNGAEEFIRRNSEKRLVLTSRAPAAVLARHAEIAGISRMHGATELYGIESMHKYITADDVPPELKAVHEKAVYAAKVVTGKIKPETYSAVPPFYMMSVRKGSRDALMISDNPVDIEYALLWGIDSITVPRFLTGSDDFSFGRIKPDALSCRAEAWLSRKLGRPYAKVVR